MEKTNIPGRILTMKFALKRILSVFLAVTIIFSSAIVGLGEIDLNSFFEIEAKAASIGDLTFVLNSSEKSYSLTDCKQSVSGELVIPDTYNGLKVTKIGQLAFYNCEKLKSITIPDSVTSIGASAFSGCRSLASIEIPDSVTKISKFSFQNCTKLNSIKLPDSINKIGDRAFYNTGYYNNIENWDESVLYIGNYLIRARESIEGDCEIEAGTKTIAALAFGNCKNITSVVIPESVDNIGYAAFKNCINLNSITLPDSVNNIEDIAFYNTGYYNNKNNWDKFALYIGNHLIRAKKSLEGAYKIKEGTVNIADWAFLNREKLKSIEIPDSVVSIGSEAFRMCENLDCVYISDVAAWCNIDFKDAIANPFYYADELYIDGRLATNVVIPAGVTSISWSAFRGCTSITSIEIPAGVTKIEKYSFRDCTNLNSITIPDSVNNIGYLAFYNTGYYNDRTNWDESALYIGNHLIRTRASLKGDYKVKDGTVTIADKAFFNRKNINSVVVSDGVSNIGDKAFMNCTNLNTITLPDSVKNIAYLAFYNTGYYNNKDNWDESAIYIGNHLIRAKTSLKGDYEVKKGTITIADKAFSNCDNLTFVKIHSSVKNIGKDIFYQCDKLIDSID